MGRGLVLYRPPEIGPQLLRAAQYVRMSREDQRYSPLNQKRAIADYATSHGFMVIRTYADEGKSGLTLRKRRGLTQLLDDVTGGRADYEAILVLDVSRWGRFQDTDESAAYEYLCRKAGIQVIYCAEEFPREAGPLGSIMKAMKRSMAGGFSRDLSVGVHRGLSMNASLGFFSGGPPGYGFRRQIVDEEGRRREILQIGQHKTRSTARVILVPGPRKEIATIRRIFHLYAHKKRSCKAIAKVLNEANIKTSRGYAWQGGTILTILTNERYSGTYLYNRTATKLGGPVVQNRQSEWIRSEGAFAPIVSADLFEAAQKQLAKKTAKLSRVEMLDRLKELLRRKGRLTEALLEEAGDMPTRKTYCSRFGSLEKAYSLIGYPVSRFARGGETIQRNTKLRREKAAEIRRRLKSLGFEIGDGGPHILHLKEELSLGIRVAARASGTPFRWSMTQNPDVPVDLTIALCADAEGKVQCVYLLPRNDEKKQGRRLGIPGRAMERYRCHSLEPFFDMARVARASGKSVMRCFEEWSKDVKLDR